MSNSVPFQRGRSRSDMSSRNGPSAPIQIPPGRRQPSLSASTSFSYRTASPDAVFEMSPVTSEFPEHSSPSFPLAHGDSTSFLYNFPSFPPQQNRSISDQLHPSHSDRSTSSLSQRCRVAEPLSIRRSPPPPKSNCVLDEYDLSLDRKGDWHPSSKGSHDIQKPEARRLERLSPGPRQPSSNTSPWIFPGRGEGTEEDMAYSQMDPSAFEFQRHLLQRIESQNPSRIMSMRSCM